MIIEETEKISSIIGDVARPIEPKDVDGGIFLWVKVTIDLSLPLCRGHLISYEKPIWVSFKYETLPN